MLTSLQGKDDEYLEIINQYEDEDVHRYAEMFGELQNGLAETDADLLGVIYEELGMDSDAFGQYFTPHNVCEAKAKMSLRDVDPDEYGSEPVTVADPACGSGRLLLYAARTLPEKVDAVFYGQDKDATCAKMTALNMCFFNIDGYSVFGDSLKLEKRRMWQTRSTAMGGELRELDEDEFVDLSVEQGSGERPADSDGTEGGLPEVEETTLSDFREEGNSQ